MKPVVGHMTEPLVVDATKAQLETVMRWLKKEALEEESGFYCNRSIIRNSFRNSEMKCLLIGRVVAGFAIFRLNTSYSAIDILEIRSGYRRNGYGKMFAGCLINMLFTQGATRIVIECAPHSSEPFWRSLGFVDRKDNKHNMFGNPKLELSSWSNPSFERCSPEAGCTSI